MQIQVVTTKIGAQHVKQVLHNYARIRFLPSKAQHQQYQRLSACLH
ncbi:hypothetical protein HMPREF3232_00882 [Fannyhessea vaginae]|nr:hypothetical protein HMPREF3232_00882 [Fannyhessea vaginae]